MSKVDVTDDPEEFAQAVRAFRRRVPMPDWQWDALTEAEREFAFKVSGVAQADLATEAWEAMDRAIKDGTTLDDFKKQVGAKLEAAWGRENPARLETIFRTNALGAYNAGRHEILSHPEVRKARPYWRFDAIMDSRTSEICEALDGTIRPADDPFWGSHTPPLHFQCRSILVPLSEEEAHEEGVTGNEPGVEPDEGFGKPPTVGGDWEPDTKDYPGPIADVLEEKLEVAPANDVKPEPKPHDYGPSFPRLAREMAPGLASSEEPAWVHQQMKVDVFVERNNRSFARAGRALEVTIGAPQSRGSIEHRVGAMRASNVLASYRDGTVTMSEKVAIPLQSAIRKGRITTAQEFEAVGAVAHEQLHGASNPFYDYEVSGGAAGEARTAGTVMEEATTELLAQHYTADYARNSLRLKVEVPQRPLFAIGGEAGPELGRAVAYQKWIRGFARLAAFADESLLDMSPEDFQHHVAGRAAQAKKLKGWTDRHGGTPSERYGMFITQVFDRYRIAPEMANQLGMELHDVFADFMQGRAGFEEQRLPDLKAKVDGILEGKGKGPVARKGPKT